MTLVAQGTAGYVSRVGVITVLTTFGVPMEVIHDILLIRARTSRIQGFRRESNMPGFLIIVHRHLHPDFFSSWLSDILEFQVLGSGGSVQSLELVVLYWVLVERSRGLRRELF